MRSSKNWGPYTRFSTYVRINRKAARFEGVSQSVSGEGKEEEEEEGEEEGAIS